MKFVFVQSNGHIVLSGLSALKMVAMVGVVGAAGLFGGCGLGSDEMPEVPEVPEMPERVGAEDANSGMIPYPGAGEQKLLREESIAASVAPASVVGTLQDLTVAEADAVARARLTLAQKLELPDVDTASLVSVNAQQWTNGSLGCAKPGEMSTQVMLDGHKVVLVLEGLRYQVHVGPSSARVCERLAGLMAVPRRSFSLGAIPGLQQRAIADLAKRFDVPESSIKAERVGAAFWPDASLGCPEPGVDYPQVQVNGYQLPLRVDGTLVVYNTDGRRVVNCTKGSLQKKPTADK